MIASSSLARVAHYLLIGLVFLTCAAAAQESTPNLRKWDFSIWVAGATGEENTDSFREAQIYSAGAFVGRTIGELGSGWRRGSVQYGFDAFPIFLAGGTHGSGFDPVIVRWNSRRQWHSASPYIELGGGGLATSRNFPVGDTSAFNFIARVGGGVNIFSSQRNAVDLGCRWWHISNANLGVRNPEFNGIQITLAYHWLK